MEIFLPAQIKENPQVILRRLGYHPYQDPYKGEISFIRRLGSYYYPRFHIYIISTKKGKILNLHLDQKKPSYSKGHAHAAEYESEVVKQEAERIKKFIHYLLKTKNP